MTNKEHEYQEHEPIKHMYGHLVLGGLGIGLAIELAKQNPAITKITVIEKNEDVIELINTDVKVVHADVYDWVPNEPVDCVWLDIWVDRAGGTRSYLTKRYEEWAGVVLCWPSKWWAKN